jgi:CubicO group peptidase (beta-lactamase class C family)
VSDALTHRAPAPAFGSYAEGFEPVARCFAHQLATGQEIGAGLSIHHRGRPVVELWGGLADVATDRRWERDTRIVVFSVTKGFAAMAMSLLADRGLLEWDAPVATYWPEFGTAGKEAITVRTLFNHRGGLLYLDTPLTLRDCIEPSRADVIRDALIRQRPAWTPGRGQGYHAITYGMYARELFERITGDELGAFLRRELFEPLGSDIYLGTPASLDARVATLYPPNLMDRVGRMIASALLRPRTTEARMARATVARDSIARRALMNPKLGREGLAEYNDVGVRRATLAWASATASANGVARAYLPFASGGAHDGRRYVRAETITPVHARQGWSENDAVLQKPVGWSQGFLKEERHLFSPNPESFGHAGLGGALGWCDPVDEIAFGYVLNRLDWHVRSPRALALCHALYECEPLRDREANR